MGETIYALATAPGRGGLAVVRVSGPQAFAALTVVTRMEKPVPRLASLRRLYDFDNETIDRGLVLAFPEPGSFTGEDVAEFHLHGGRAVVERLLTTLGRIAGLRLATRGEFTRRAVENGKLDLTRAEAISDLVDAETEAQRRQAFAQFEGGLYAIAETWRARLVQVLAHAEAAIDFGEDEVPEEAFSDAMASLRATRVEMEQLLGDGRRGEILREGVHLTVVGPPNAGKSSLVNALARRDVAIVSDIPGTTRDVVEARLDIGGYPVIVADTAGLRETSEQVEQEGVRRARARASAGDITLLLLDGSVDDPLTGLEPDILQSADIVVWNKADLDWPAPHRGLSLSLRSGQGFDSVMNSLVSLVQDRFGRREGAVLTRSRHREAVADAVSALHRCSPGSTPELMAEDIRLALRAMGRLTGRVDIEDLLDVVFRDFCIGK